MRATEGNVCAITGTAALMEVPTAMRISSAGALIMRFLRACRERLRQTWNLEEDSPSKIGTPPRPLVPIQGMITGMDFPRQALAKVWSGTTSFVLLIDETGKVRDCTLTETSGIAVIDSRTCAVIAYKARFDPAIGANGKPVKSAFAQRITWRVTD